MIEIHAGNFWETNANIPDESIDLILTDPDYKNIDDYRRLSEVAARVLKPDTSLLAFYAGGRPIEILQALNTGLRYRWTFHYCVMYKSSPIGWKLFTHMTYLYWFVKGNSKPYRWLSDVKMVRPPSGAIGKDPLYKYGKQVQSVIHYLTAFTRPGDLVLDPFVGGGTTPAACKMTERNFVGYEIDAEVAESAKQRVSKVQLPLFVLDPIQTELEIP